VELTVTLEKITNHKDQALARQREMYKRAARFTAYVSAHGQQAQDIEDALWASIAGRTLEGATGATLDALGARYGLTRNGLSDDIYRSMLRGTIAALNSQGRQEDIVSAARGLFGCDAVFMRTPNSIATSPSPSATIAIGVGSPTLPSWAYPLAISILLKSLSAGVSIDSLVTFDASSAFSTDAPRPWNIGLGDVDDASVGGGLADGIYVNRVA